MQKEFFGVDNPTMDGTKKSQTGFYFDTNFCGGNIYCEWRDIFRIYMCEKSELLDLLNDF